MELQIQKRTGVIQLLSKCSVFSFTGGNSAPKNEKVHNFTKEWKLEDTANQS